MCPSVSVDVLIRTATTDLYVKVNECELKLCKSRNCYRKSLKLINPNLMYDASSDCLMLTACCVVYCTILIVEFYVHSCFYLQKISMLARVHYSGGRKLVY